MIDYSHTLGIASFEGRGFMNPIDLSIDSNGLLYVLSRSNASNQDVRVSVLTVDSDYKFEFARWGTEPGQTIHPTSIAIDKDNRVYISDEYLNNISIFKNDGTFIKTWGEFGSDPGMLNRPSGIRFDSEGNLIVIDHLNSRIQKFSPDGDLLLYFGSFGSNDGEFNYPWGVSIDSSDQYWVADWRNDRVQIFDSSGKFSDKFGKQGSKDGEFNRPSNVHVSNWGEIFVSDWWNNRVQVFDKNKNHLQTLYGDATLSKWCEDFLSVNPEQASWRDEAGLFEEEKRFWRPTSVNTSSDGNIFITDSCRHRVQIYKRTTSLINV
ncbi:MAG: hypothetical protein CL780_06820 [Chloroflexi bacterium]|nr:hypothetical protein [Chloroflexota bacterium]